VPDAVTAPSVVLGALELTPRLDSWSCGTNKRALEPPPGIPPGLLAVPCRDSVLVGTMCALFRLYDALPIGSRFATDPLTTTIAAKRNHFIRNLFLPEPSLAWVLFIDDDMMPPADTLARLWAWQQPIVGGLYIKRGWPWTINAGQLWKIEGQSRWQGGDFGVLHAGTPALAPVDYCGTGCLLVRRSVFETLPDPWFEPDPEDVHEDSNFGAAARGAGFPVYLDTTLKVGHFGLTSVIADDPRPGGGRETVTDSPSGGRLQGLGGFSG
jgi:hypothetical protein